jgi:hypothetical protein
MTRAPGAHSETAGCRARTPVEDDSKLSTGSTSTWKFLGRRALENIDLKSTGRVARKQAGQSLIESALILTAFMGLIVGMAGTGELLFVRETLADRARMAARWGAMNRYDPSAIRRMVLFGMADNAPGQTAFFGLTPAAVEVSNPGCPGPSCRVSVAIPEHGIRSVEPVEEDATPPAVASLP